MPVLLVAGRTPLTEAGHPGSRNRTIHWGQECFDQRQMVREFVTWDHELRGGQPVEVVASRTIAAVRAGRPALVNVITAGR